MAIFTMQTRNAIKALGATYVMENGLIKVTGDIGLSNYPIFNETHRETLNSLILRTYWLQEIGVETPEMWRFNMETAMMLHMPYFNELYKSTLIEYDPLVTMDILNTGTSKASESSTDAVDTKVDTGSESGARDVRSAFPQTILSGNGDYASDASDSTSRSKSTVGTDVDTTHEGESEGNTTSHTKGYQGRPGELIQSYRDAILNVDLSVVNMLEDQFMQLRSVGTAYSDRYTFERYT